MHVIFEGEETSATDESTDKSSVRRSATQN
jgi:hypothetical protein